MRLAAILFWATEVKGHVRIQSEHLCTHREQWALLNRRQGSHVWPRTQRLAHRGYSINVDKMEFNVYIQ